MVFDNPVFYILPQDCLIMLWLIGNPCHTLNKIRILVGYTEHPISNRDSDTKCDSDRHLHGKLTFPSNASALHGKVVILRAEICFPSQNKIFEPKLLFRVKIMFFDRRRFQSRNFLLLLIFFKVCLGCWKKSHACHVQDNTSVLIHFSRTYD